MVERLTESRRGVKEGFPLAGSRDSVPCGVWGNAPTVPRATSMQNALNQGAGSEASLPVTSRSRRSAPSCTFDHSHIVAPDGRDQPVWETICFPDAGLFCCKRFRLCGGESGALRSPPTPLRTALPCFLIFLVAGGIAPAGATRGLSDRPLDPFGSHYRSWFFIVARRIASSTSQRKPL